MLVRRRSTVSPDTFTIHWKEADREVVVGYLHRVSRPTSSSQAPWEWSVEFHQREGRAGPHFGYAETLEAAGEAFKRCWESADVPINWPPSLRRGD